MSSLTGCIKKAGAALSKADKDAIVARANALRAEGLSAIEAGRQAVDERLAEVQGQIKGIAPLVPEAEPAQATAVSTGDKQIQDLAQRMKAMPDRVALQDWRVEAVQQNVLGFAGEAWQVLDKEGQPFGPTHKTKAAAEKWAKTAELDNPEKAAAMRQFIALAMQRPAPTTHQDPGERPEAATQAVVKESLTVGARNAGMKPSEMRAYLLRKIDEAIPDSKGEDDADVLMYEATAPGTKMTPQQMAEYKRLGVGSSRDRYMKRLADEMAGQHARAAERIGHVTFNVPGDGKFKVLNTRNRLEEFRKKVEKSPGFKDTSAPVPVARINNDGDTYGVERGSSGPKAAIESMIDAGDPQAAVDYAAARGLVLADVLKGDKERLPQVANLTPTEAEPVAEFEQEAPREARTDAIGSGKRDLLAEFIASYDSPQEGGSARTALDRTVTWRSGARGAVGSFILDEYRKGARVVMTGSGPAFVHSDMRGWSKRDVGEYGMQFANWLSSRDDAPAPAAPTQLTFNGPATAQRAIDAFNADDAPLAQAVMGKLPLAALQEVGAAIGFRPQINENAKSYRARVAEVADRLTKTAREQSARERRLFDTLMDRAMQYDRSAEHAEHARANGVSEDSTAFDSFYRPMDGGETQMVRIPEMLSRLARDVRNLRGDPDYDKVAAMVRNKRPRVFEAADALPAEGAGPTEVQNFGEALPPARRAMAAKLDEALSDDDIANRPLSEIWPLAENEAIEDTFAAAVAHAARAEVPAKPRVAYKLTRWVQKVKTVRELAGMIVSGRVSRDALAEQIKGPRRTLADWWTKVQLLEQVPRDQWKRIGEVEERPDAAVIRNEKRVPRPIVRIRIDGQSHWLEGDGTLAGAMAKIRELLANAAPEQRMEFTIYERRSGGGIFVTKKGDPEKRLLMEFATVAEARAAVNEYAGLAAAWEAVKARDNITERDLRSAENRPRAGKDHRNGKDVSTEQFQQAFGFRGGEFGGWVQQGKGDKERQSLLNQSYDALMDLADIIGVPPRALSLNGTLGIALGSRGSGWASAHFEPSNLVINLTKTRGAGTLAHEWFHAADNYFSRMRRGGEEAPFNGNQNQYREQNYITHKPEPLMVRKDGSRYFRPMTKARLEGLRTANPTAVQYAEDKWQPDPEHPSGVRPEVEQRFAALVQALKDSPMAKRAALLDKGGGYWSRTLELAARAFENYVIAKMHEQGYHNDFLVNVKKSDETGKADARYPYLLAGEVKPIAEAFDALFGAMQTRTDENGKTVLFSRRGSPISQAAPQTETPAFRRWFGDSKVVDADGKPLVVYHGTTADLSAFDLAFSGSDGVAYDRPAIFATDDARLASDYARNKRNRSIADAGRAFQRFKNENPGVYDDEYERLFEAYKASGRKEGWDIGGGANVLPLYLSIQNPLEVDGGGQRFMQVMPDAVKQATAQGRDGVIVRNVIDHASPASEYPATVYVAFRPEQIKSATGNSGAFDPENPDIRMNRQGSAAVNLPPAALGGSLARVNNHPDYTEAKAGDAEAAYRLARDLVTDGFVEEVRQLIGAESALLVPVISQESTGRNKIPLAVAEVLVDRLGLDTHLESAQATRTHRTQMDGLSRVLKSPEFYGAVTPGARYVLVDDTLTQGGTFASLANHIRAGGGEVLGVAALSGKRYSAALTLSDENLSQLRERFGDVEPEFRAATGYGFDALTESEARYLVKHDAPEQVRDRIAAAGREAGFKEDARTDGARARDGRRLSSETPQERFRRLLGVPAQGIPLSTAKRLAQAYTGSGLNTVNVAATPDDLPADLRRRLEGAADDVRGAYFPDRDQVWVFSDRVSSPDEFAFVVLHEAFHRGLGQTFGRDAKRLLGQMYQTNRRLRERADRVAKELGIDRDTAIEEALADMAAEGKAQKLRGWSKLAAMIRTWLGRVMDAVGLRMEFTDAQIETFVAGVAARGLQSGPRVTTGADVGRLVAASETRMPKWYSELARQIAALRMNAAPAQGWLDAIKGMTAKGVKPDEIEWSGITDWLAMQRGKVTRDQLLEFLAANGVQVEETALGQPDESDIEALLNDEIGEGMTREEAIEYLGNDEGATPTKYANYQLPGGQNYREVLLTLPESKPSVSANGWTATLLRPKSPVTAKPEFEIRDQDGNFVSVIRTVDDSQRAINLAASQLYEYKKKSANYRSSHWDQPNVLAHIRLNDRTDADGNRVLFVEEVQSDWGQEGKKKGFASKAVSAEKVGDVKRIPGNGLRDRYEQQWKITMQDGSVQERSLPDGVDPLLGSGNKEGPPAAPFVTKTEGWLNLALKRIVKMAVDEGYDRVAFVNGEQSAERYDLSKQINSLAVYRDGDGFKVSFTAINGGTQPARSVKDADELADTIGKDLAKKAIEDLGERRSMVNYTGLDLKVGGEGMKAFYDSIVPNAVKALLKKVGGGALGTVKVGIESDNPDAMAARIYGAGTTYRSLPFESKARVDEQMRKGTMPQPGFDITPAMRDKARGGMPLFSRRASTSAGGLAGLGITQQSIRNALMDRLNSAGAKVHWWHKTLGTQYDKAKSHPMFGRVFNTVQQYLEDTSTLATEAADLAPSILPKLESVRDVFSAHTRGLSAKDRDAIASPVFEGTLLWTRQDGKLVKLDELREKSEKLSTEQKERILFKAGHVSEVELKRWLATPLPIYEGAIRNRYEKAYLQAGVVFNDSELRSLYKLNDAQIKQYREFRAAVDASLDQVVAADALRMLNKSADIPEELRRAAVGDRDAFRAAVDRILTARIEAGGEKEDVDALINLRADLGDKYAKVDELKARGYAPLMRFGRYAVSVRGEGDEMDFFGLYETPAEANRMARQLEGVAEFRGRVEQSTMSQEQYKLFNAVPLESLEMFAEAIGAEQSEVFQEYLRLAKSNRSALKRLIQRKGIAGFNEDVTRVLASFVTSNARMAAGTINLGQARELAQDIKEGDTKDEAVKLIEAVENPVETARPVRGLMFAHFIGGSIASALVNVTQPVMMTTPYLSQWGGMTKASARLLAAARMAAGGKIADKEMAAALRRAEQDGIVSPQEIHHLTAEAMGTFGRNPVLKRAAFLWASPFSLAEQFNRRVSFLAAYQTAKAENIPDPFAFAEKAVIETQGLYNKGNAPNLARNPVGAVALTFKQYSIHYFEWLKRMWNTGAPGSPERAAGRKAVRFALALLLMAGGVEGLPFMEDLNDLFDTLLQAAGITTSAKGWKRDFLANTLGMGDEAADSVMRGFSAIPGIPLDVSMRMGMGNLLPGTGMLLRSNTDVSRDVLELAGPFGSLLGQAKDAGQKALSGDAIGAVKAVLPVGLANMAKGMDIWMTDEYRDTKGRKVMDADEMDGAMKFLGFQPAEIVRESSTLNRERRRVQLTRNVESQIADLWAQGLRERDPELVQEARQELLEWNQTNPESRISITNAQVLRRLREMQSTRADRFERAAPKELRAGLGL